MKVSIVNIGDELLSGKTLNTNSFWIKRKLFSCGLFIDSQITVQDETESIISGLDYCITKKPEYLLITGGLGPTNDDITRDVLFKYFNTEITKEYGATKIKNDLYILQLRDKNYTYAPREAQLRTFSNFPEPFLCP